jgi:hypothetical protein
MVAQSSEAGVDVLLSVEMIKHAAMREHDYLALVSSDRDFLPVLSYLKDQGQRVLHVSTGVPNREMRSLTWSQVELVDMYPSLCSIDMEDRLVLTSPKAEKLEEAKTKLDQRNLKYKVVDITNVEDISDKDLGFLLRNQHLSFTKLNDQPGRSYMGGHFSNDLFEFRKLISNGLLQGQLPYILNEGQMEAYFDNRHGWVTSGATESQIWKS